MNRYEILIGKEPPPEPVKIREIMFADKRGGKTTELIHCVRNSLIKKRSVIVCVFHPNKYMMEKLGPLLPHVKLIGSSDFRTGRRFFGAKIDSFYYDDIDLQSHLPELSNSRFFYEAEEIIVSVDTFAPHGRGGLCEYLNIHPAELMGRHFPMQITIGMTTWDIVPVSHVRARDIPEEPVFKRIPEFKL